MSRVFCLFSAALMLPLTAPASAQSVHKVPPSAPAYPVLLPLQHRDQLNEIAGFDRIRLQVPDALGQGSVLRVPWAGETYTLELRKHSVRAAGFQVLEHRADDTLVPVDPGEVRTFLGSVREDKSAVVVGSLLPTGLEAEIRLGDGRVLQVEPDFEAFSSGDRQAFLVFDQRSLVVDAPVKCEATGQPRPVQGGTEGAGCGPVHCVAQLALDLDYSFLQSFGFEPQLARDEAEYITLIANLQYLREVGIDHRITTIIIRTSLAFEPAGYASSAGTGDLLTAMKAHWDANHGGIVRDLAHLLTSRHVGGTAYIGTVCNLPFAYGVNGPAFGYGLRCIANVLAHEMGHSWNAAHCACAGAGAEYTMNPTFPPCPLRFHPSLTQPAIQAYRDSTGCLTPGVVNDTPDDAIPITPGTYYGSTVNATVDGTSSCGSTSSSPDVWYVYKPAANGNLTLSTCGGGTNYDTVLALYDGGIDLGLSEIACNDDFCGVPSQVSVAVTAGTSYFVRVTGFNTAAGDFELAVDGPDTAAPLNDGRENALLVGPGDFYGTTASATTVGESASCGASMGSPDVWYRYIPRATSWATFDLCGSLGYDTVLGLYDAGGTELACNDDWCGLASRIEYAVTAGVEYMVRVSGFDGAAGGYHLSIGGPEAWNAVCTNALPALEGTTAVSFYGTYEIDGEAGCAPDEPAYFFRWTNTEPCDGNLTVSTCGTHDLCGEDLGVDTVVSVYSACPADAGTELACNDDNPSCGDQGTVRDSSVTVAVAMGETVWIRLSRYSAYQGRGIALLNLSFDAPVPANDSCANAFSVGNDTYLGTLCGATNDGSATCGASATAPDVWYVYPALCNGTLVVTTCGTHDLNGVDQGVDTVLSIYSNACPGTLGTELACNDDADTSYCGAQDVGAQLRDSVVQIPVVAGGFYRIRVASFGGVQEGPFVLNLQCVSGTPYCDALPNATGFPAYLTATGDPSSGLVFTSTPVPNTTGQFFFGPMMLNGGSNLGDGLRCVGGATTRLLPFVNAGMMAQPPNTAIFAVSYTAPYASGLTGTKYFQHWFRSGLATGTGSNGSNGLEITF